MCFFHLFINSYIADCTTPDERPKYLARLEAFLAAAYIFGPAIGGFLGEISLGLPFIVAGLVAGIALLFVIIFLSESLDKEAVKKRKEKKTKKTNYKKVFAPVIVSFFTCHLMISFYVWHLSFVIDGLSMDGILITILMLMLVLVLHPLVSRFPLFFVLIF